MGVEERYKKRQGSGENKSVYNGVEARYVNNNWNTISSNLNSRINSWLQKNNSYMSTYQTRVSGLTGTYNDKYDSGVSDWLSAITTQKTNLETEASELKSELETYKDYLGDNYSKVLSLLDSATKAQSDVIKGATDYSKYWSNWETEDAYNEWAASMKDREEKLTFNLEEGKAEIERLQGYAKMWDEAASSVQSLRISIEQKERELAYGHFVDRDKLQREITAEKGKLAGYESILEQLDGAKVKKDLPQKQAYYTQAERLQNAEALKNNAINASDFETYAAKGAAIKNPTPKEAENGVYIFGNRLGGDVEIGNVVTYSRDNYEAMAFGEMNGGGSQYGKSIYHFMTDDEVKIYNYYIGKGDKTNAQKYLDSLEETLNQRHGGMVYENLEGNTALEMVFGVAAGLDQFRTGVVNLFNGEDYIPTSSVQFTSGMIREDLADAGDGVNIFGSSLGQAAYDAITTTSNMLPSILVGAGMNAVLPGVGSAVGNALLSVSAAGNAKAEMLNLGYSKDQANGYALLVGASEGALQYLLGGISSLGGKLTGDVAAKVLGKVDNALARVAIQTGLGMLGEGIEEGLQTALEPWFKSLVGLDYEAPEIDEILYSGLLGAISAFGLEGAGNTSAAVQTSKVGKDIKQIDGGVQKLIEAGQTYSADSVAFKLASKIDENTGAYTIGRLFIEEGATLSEQKKTEIIEGLKSLGVNSSDAQSLARTYELYLNESVQFTDAQKKLLEKTSPLSRVLREKIIGENTTVYQRTKGYTDLSRLANEVANGKNAKAATDTAAETTAEVAEASQDGERAMFRTTNAPYASARAEASTDPIAVAVRRVQSDMVADSRLSATEKNLKSNKALVDTAAKSTLKVKGEYTANETGVTRVKNSNERVSVTDVVSTENGQLKVRLNNNKVVDAKELAFSSPDEALVYEAVANMGVDPASAMSIIKGFDPKGNQSGATYALGMIEAYTYGQYNISDMSHLGFTSMLSAVQKKTAYDLGRIKSRADAAAAQAKVDTAVNEAKRESKKQGKPVAKRKGEVVYDESVDKSSLSESQNAQISVVEKVAEKLGTKIHFFASSLTDGKRGFKTADGEVVTDNGWYDRETGEIWIDVNAGVNGNGLILYTTAHELTHFIKEWSPEKYKVFADFLVKTYGEHGKSINEIVRERMANSKHDLSYDEAFDEVVARSCETFLQDSKAAVKIAALRAKDASLAQKIKSFLGQLLAKVRKLAEELGLAPDSQEGKLVAEMTDSLEKLYDLWTDALIDAGRSYQAAGVAMDSNTESVAPQFSERTWTASEYVTERNAAAKRLAESLGVTLKQATKYIDNVNSIAKAIANDRARLDYEASSFGSAFVSNVEYGGSFDFTTLCKKRRIYTGTFQEIQKQIGDNALTPDDILEIRNMMLEGGIEATCGLCYVEGSRANMGKFAKEFIKLYKRDNPDGWTPTMVDVNTPDGVEQMRINHPEAYERYEYFWNHYGKLQDSDPALFASQQKPKLYEARKEYKGEILQHFKDVDSIAKKNLNGGIRMQSFSDFEIVHLIDTMQIIMDMANVGLAGQAYTKVPEFAEAFGNTGLKINLSLIAKGVDADGKLIFDDREGMPAETAFKLRDKYSSNVGTILVIFTDEQLKAAMADPRVDFIIPFHRSQWKKSQYGAMGLPKGTKDYTFMQNEKLIKPTYHEYRGRMVKDKASNYMPNEYWDFSKSGKENAEAYLEMCAENNKRPKFYKLLDFDGKGKYSLKKDGSTDGYWKLLIDFKMYDNDGVGVPQRAVTPDFSMDEAMTMLEEYKGGHQSYPIAHGVVDKFVEAYKEKGKQYSERYQAAEANADILALAEKVESGEFKANEKVYLGDVSEKLAKKIESLTGINVDGFKVAIEARQMVHILKDHGKNGKADRSMADLSDIAKMEYTLNNYDNINAAGRTLAYSYMVNGKNRTAPTVLYEKAIGEKSYYVVQAVPETKTKTLFIVTAFIGKSGYKKEVSQLINAKSPDATSEFGSATTSGSIISHLDGSVKSKSKNFSERDSAPTFYSHMSKVIDGIKPEKMGAGGVVSYLKGKGVKNEEIKWSGIEAFLEGKKSVTKAELQEFAAGNMLQIGEQMSEQQYSLRYDSNTHSYTAYDTDGSVIDTYTYGEFIDAYIAESDEEMYSNVYDIEEHLREGGAASQPRWSEYKLDGGSNYREIVFTMPDSSYSNRAMRAHWGQDAEGVLAHARIQDLTTKDGDRMLFVEELQSDWHNEGARQGYTTEEYEDTLATYNTLAEEYAKMRRAFNQYVRSGDFRSDPDDVSKKKFDWLRRKMDTAEKRMQDAEKDVEALKKKGAGDTPDAPFRNNYHEFVMKRLLRMAAEEGYDVLGWTPAQVQSERWSEDYSESYRIEYDQDIPSFLKKYGKKWGATVGTATTSKGYDVWSMNITDSMKASVLTEGQPLYSERDPAAVSNREILATSLESAAQNDIERRRLAEYKKKVEHLDEEQAKLAEVKRRIHDLSFSKGKRDMATLKKLKESAIHIEARINTYDRQLLSLEATKPIRDVLTREKDLVRKREQEKAKENLTIYKEHAEKRQAERDEYYRDIIRRNREAARDSKEKAIAKVKQESRDSRARSEERRDKTTMRNKIRKQVESLNTLLLNPTKEKHIPMHLQKPVAEMLAIVNMESSNSVSMKEKLQLLKVAYDEIIESDDPIIAGSYHPEVSERIGNLASLVGDTPLGSMTLEQLDYLYESFKILETIVRNANKGFKIAKGQTISTYSSRVMEEIHKVGGSGHMSNKLLDGISQYRWNNLKPVYAFEHIGSDTFSELFENVRAGEDTWASDVSEAREYFLAETKKHGYYDWDMEETHTFEGKFGKKFDLTLPQMMSLYAYSKRAQADKHLEDGGFVFEDAVIVTKKKFGVPIKYTVKKANPHSLAREHLAAVVGALTDSQRAFVDEMQEYLSSTMGAKGNEVSREMYGIDLFKEKYYFPLKSSNYYMSYNPEKDAQARIKNYGMAKETVKHANNPIVLSDFMSVWGNHIDEMSMYHAFVLPLEDFSRVFNYNTPTSEEYNKESVQQYLADAYGDEAISYIKNLLTDLNGGARTDPTIGWANKLIGRFKKAKVFLSASVVVQQPSAIGRAFAYINPKYFTPNLKQKHGEAWAEVKKYAPVAIIKEMGYFDTNVGKSTVDYITAREYEGLKEKAKGIITDSNYRDEAMGKLPALADEATWNQIWQAVKNEIADTTDLERDSEEFLTAAGKRFTEVVTKTQVYDSVLSKSAFMRSKDGLAKMITAFLAEPTTSINMIGNAIIQGERGNKKLARNIVGGVAASVILNSVLVSLVYAARDDDEDETFTEKYIESLTTELLEGINPATYLPYIKDIWSLAQGYDIERTDMSLFSDLMAAVKSMFSESKSGWEKTEELATTVADLFGLPLNNVLRDAKALYNTAKSFVDGAETTGTGIAASIGDAIRSSIPFGDKILPEASKKQRLYDAVIGGDETQIARMKALFKDNAAIESALRSALRESDSRITKAAKAHLEGNVSERVRLAKEIIAEGNFSQDLVVAAINAEINDLKKKAEEDSPETTEPEEETEEVISYYRADDINAALEGGDTKLALEIIEDLVATKTSNGMEEKNAKSSIKSSVTSYWKPLYKKAYKNKDAEEMKRIRNLLYASGLYGRPSEVLETVKKWLKDS